MRTPLAARRLAARRPAPEARRKRAAAHDVAGVVGLIKQAGIPGHLEHPARTILRWHAHLLCV